MTPLLLENTEGGSIIRSPSHPPTPRMVEFQSRDKTAGVPSPKRAAHFTANRAVRGSRRRPVFNRCKSSQTLVPKAPSPSSQRLVHTGPTESIDPFYDDDDFLAPMETTHNPPRAKQALESAWTDLEPSAISGPVPHQPSSRIAPHDMSLITERLHPSKQPNIAAAVLAISDKQDPILPPGIETVRRDPGQEDPRDQFTEPKDHSSSDTDTNNLRTEDPTEETDVPGFPGAKGVPMPESMANELIGILTNTEPLKERIPLPDRPWFLAEHAWQRLPRKEYLYDWMIQDETTSVSPQPSGRPLVTKGFRKRSLEQVVAARAAVQNAQDGLWLLDVGEPERDIWEDQWESDTPAVERGGPSALASERGVSL